MLFLDSRFRFCLEVKSGRDEIRGKNGKIFKKKMLEWFCEKNNRFDLKNLPKPPKTLQTFCIIL